MPNGVMTLEPICVKSFKIGSFLKKDHIGFVSVCAQVKGCTLIQPWCPDFFIPQNEFLRVLFFRFCVAVVAC